ncbi:membrane integrity-associated transporter subunit PqiC [Psychrobium sp. 1_MG-2023]|uniref:PqiC family protein n=1 Tax=Psychrobium sp. 1_MG-2023 TaxID=3062624 RepID=UPI000C33892A|nr:ABC-type transport auxiliary lipoprotein family protein [Psychrobium sp. 1_MG-2023]MDP2561442.1 ABC-type transport auxiliary lipoprotein family protein [Psychrobium sp. 1_MG-2023]PKF57709.1 hypothetical protein CW748_05815 [Alteromonadales bacterium alter-6D02]
MIKPLIILSLGILLLGCQTPRMTVSYYQLAPMLKEGQQVALDKPQLLVEPVRLVDYLQRPNLLLKLESNELFVTKYQVWAEPLADGISRTIVNTINTNQQSIRADSSVFTRCRKKDQCVSLELLVESFYPTEQATVEFSGKYRLIRNRQVIHQEDFMLSRTLELDGYVHSVDLLRGLVTELSTKISQQVSHLE